LLLNAGFILRKVNPNQAYIGLSRVNFDTGKAVLPQTVQGTPAYNAGLDVDDVILTLDHLEIKDQATLTKITDSHKPGDVVLVSYLHRGEQKSTNLTFAENPVMEIVPIEKTGGALTKEMQAFRDKWLNSQVKTK